MTNTEKIEIPFSKRKFTLILLASVFCFLLGLWLVVYPPPYEFYLFHLILINKSLLGAGLIAFFGFSIFFCIIRIFGNKAGLTMDSKGIDNSSGISEQILWTDIQEIKTTNVGNQNFILLIVKNPDEYISRQTKLIKRKIMQTNYKNYGTPVMVSVNGLECNLDELLLTIQSKYKESKGRTNH